jgi:hypothetical protein
MKDKDPIDCDYFKVEAKQQPQEKVIRICLRDTDGKVLAADDPDAITMSQQYPDEKIITVYHNGIPEVMSVNQLIKEALIQVKGNVEA